MSDLIGSSFGRNLKMSLSFQVSSSCVQSMRIFETLIHPRVPCLNGPVVCEHVLKVDTQQHSGVLNNTENVTESVNGPSDTVLSDRNGKQSLNLYKGHGNDRSSEKRKLSSEHNELFAEKKTKHADSNVESVEAIEVTEAMEAEGNEPNDDDDHNEEDDDDDDVETISDPSESVAEANLGELEPELTATRVDIDEAEIDDSDDEEIPDASSKTQTKDLEILGEENVSKQYSTVFIKHISYNLFNHWLICKCWWFIPL